MTSDKIKDFGIGLGFLALQLLLFRHLKIYGMQPDLVLIFLLWFTARTGRTSAIAMAAILGFMQDAMLDLWGLNMFAKVLLVFVGYNFLPKKSDVRLVLGQVFLVALVAALTHNLIFIGLSSIMQNYSAEYSFWQQWIGNSIYTACLAGFIQLFRTK